MKGRIFLRPLQASTRERMLDRLQVILGDRYRVTGEIGGGGMSRVFDGVDPSLDRRVAIKVLPPELSLEVEAERFRREVLTAAKLQHPHIVPLLASGSAEGILWYAMPFVEGESLRSRLAREGALPLSDAVRLWRELLDALRYAHGRGIVHRDIKPENLMLSDGHLQVADFGIARALSAEGAPRITMSGLLVGTPAYMSPEQAAGDAHIDHRTDLYSAALVAYEMLGGRPPFTGSTPQRLMAAHATEAPPPLRSLRPAVPEALASLVHHGLEKDPADRLQSAEAFLNALESVAIAITPTRTQRAPDPVPRPPNKETSTPRWRARLLTAALGAAVFGGGWFAWQLTDNQHREAPHASEPRELIEVAQFGGVNVDQSLTDAVTRAVRSDLGLGAGVTVPDDAARATLREVASSYVQGIAEGRYGRAEVLEIARRTALKAYVHGNVTRLGSGVLIEASLVDAASDTVLFAVRAEAADSTGLRRAIQVLTKQLLTAAESKLPSLPEPLYLGFATTNSRAALHLWATANQLRATGDWLTPVLAYRQALALDSTFVLAAASLVNVLHNPGFGAGEIGRAIELTESGLEGLPPQERVGAEWVIGYARRDRAAMLRLARERTLVTPQNAGAHNFLGLALRDHLDVDGAIRAYGVARRLDPEGGTSWGNLAGLLANADRREALDSLLRADSAATERWGAATVALRARLRAALEGDIRPALPRYASVFAGDTNRISIRVSSSAEALRTFHAMLGQLRVSERYAFAQDTLLDSLSLPGDLLRSRIERLRIRGILTGTASASADSIARTLAAGRSPTSHALDRIHARAAFEYALLGDTLRARQELEEYRRTTPRTLALRDSAFVLHASAELAFLEGRWDDAIAIADERERQRPCYRCTAPLVARAHAAAGRSDSAIVVLEQFLAKLTPWSFAMEHEVPRTMRVLAGLYEAKGDRARALYWHERFVDLWRDADPEMQTLVEQSRGRIEALRPPG